MTGERSLALLTWYIAGPADICMSMPCVVGSAGIEQVLRPAMEAAETAAPAASAAKLSEAFEAHLAARTDGMQ
jgi:L-lactate dehydrogenase